MIYGFYGSHLFSLLLLTKKDIEILETLSVSPASINDSASGNAYIINITSNTHFTISKNVSWLNLSETVSSGDLVLNCSIDENFESTGRSGELTIETSGGLIEIITINQSAAAETLSVSPNLFYTSSLGATEVISVTSNCHYTIMENVAFLTVSKSEAAGNTTFTFTILQNFAEHERVGIITLTTDGGIIKTITVNQTASGEI